MMSSLIDSVIKISKERGGETAGKENSEYPPGYILKFSLIKVDRTKVVSFYEQQLLNKLSL